MQFEEGWLFEWMCLAEYYGSLKSKARACQFLNLPVLMHDSAKNLKHKGKNANT
jgi:hypothetical protein